MIVPLRTKPSGLYRHRRGLGFTWSRLQRRKYNIRIAKLVFHAKESPIQTRDRVLSLVSSRSNSPDKAYSPAVWIPPNPRLPHAPPHFFRRPFRRFPGLTSHRGGFLDLPLVTTARRVRQSTDKQRPTAHCRSAPARCSTKCPQSMYCFDLTFLYEFGACCL